MVVIAVIFIATTSGGKDDDGGDFIGSKNEINILADDITIAVGQTVELQIGSSVPRLNANYNDCIDTYWNNEKTSDDTYYLEVTGVEVGTCYLKVHDYNNSELYDTIVVNVVASEEEILSSGSVDDSVDIGPVYTTISVPQISPSTLSIDQISQNTVAVESASMLSYSGNISNEKQKDSYYFEAPYDGRYRIDLTEIQSGTAMELYLFNASGEKIVADTYCKTVRALRQKDCWLEKPTKFKFVMLLALAVIILQ